MPPASNSEHALGSNLLHPMPHRHFSLSHMPLGSACLVLISINIFQTYSLSKLSTGVIITTIFC